MYKRTRKFIGASYTIDYEKKDISIRDTYNFFVDFIWDFFLKFFTYFIIILFLSAGFNDLIKLMGWQISFYTVDVGVIAIITLVPLILIFNILYILLPYRWLAKVQMILEWPTYFFLRWKTLDIKLNNTKEVRLDIMYYKYNLELYGKAKKDIKSIEYIMTSSFKMNNIFLIKFKQPTTGRLKLKFRGGIKNVKIE